MQFMEGRRLTTESHFLRSGEHYHNKSVIAYIPEGHTRDICNAFGDLRLEVKYQYGENNEC